MQLYQCYIHPNSITPNLEKELYNALNLTDLGNTVVQSFYLKQYIQVTQLSFVFIWRSNGNMIIVVSTIHQQRVNSFITYLRHKRSKKQNKIVEN